MTTVEKVEVPVQRSKGKVEGRALIGKVKNESRPRRKGQSVDPATMGCFVIYPFFRYTFPLTVLILTLFFPPAIEPVP